MPSNEALRQRTQDFARFLNSHRVLLYFLASVVTVSAVIVNALKNYSNFYSVAIYLSKSSRSVLVLANFGILIALLCGHVVQKIFFGSLRPNEVERLYDRLWFFITESLLAFTIFRDEFDTSFALMFGFLLFVKSFHWLAGDRIEWMDQRPYPGPSLLFHVRMSSLFILLFITDFFMFLLAVENTLTNGVGGMVLFASEYGILMASITNTVLKYWLSAYEFRRAGRRGGENAPPWENKSMWMFYIELGTDFLKLTTYLVFFTIIITFYGLPLNIIRDVYITARSFITRLQALRRYQIATRNMDQRYPNATEQELSTMTDRTCIICREEMILREAGQAQANLDGPNMTPKKLPCGHIFHFYCLRSWLERQQSCPTCRRTVLEENIRGQHAGDGAAPPIPVGPPQQAGQMGMGIPQRNNPVPQGPNNPLGNPLGFVGRLFGPPAAPGNQAPGLPPQIQIPQNLNLGNADNGQHPPGILIQYQIQYQPQPGQQQGEGQRDERHQPPPREFLPVPQFPGFHGPGREWHPWVANGQHNNRQIPPTPTVQEFDISSSSGSQDTQATTPDSNLPRAETSQIHDPRAASTPREAAALAAMRRFNSTASESGASSVKNATGDIAAAAPISDAPLNSRKTSTFMEPDRHGNASLDGLPEAPRLIPLHDLSAHLSAPGSPPHSSVRTIQSQEEPHGTLPSMDSIPLQMNSASAGQHHSAHATNSLPTLSSLPPTLTDHQLALMDTLTREAIDERLRVLEGVSGTLHRCIDELIRIRSSLPYSSHAAAATQAPVATQVPLGAVQTMGTTSPLQADESEPSIEGSSRSMLKRPETKTRAQISPSSGDDQPDNQSNREVTS